MTSDFAELLPQLESERDIALRRLQDAFAQGQLTSNELDQRLHLALTARDRDQLVAAAALPVPFDDRSLAIVARRGTIRRRGPWRVPRVMRIESDYSKVDLDFSRAVFESPTVDLELQLRFGRARIILPADTVVDLDGLQSDWKQPRYTPPRHSTMSGRLIRIHGAMEYGRLRIRHRRR